MPEAKLGSPLAPAGRSFAPARRRKGSGCHHHQRRPRERPGGRDRAHRPHCRVHDAVAFAQSLSRGACHASAIAPFLPSRRTSSRRWPADTKRAGRQRRPSPALRPSRWEPGCLLPMRWRSSAISLQNWRRASSAGAAPRLLAERETRPPGIDKATLLLRQSASPSSAPGPWAAASRCALPMPAGPSVWSSRRPKPLARPFARKAEYDATVARGRLKASEVTNAPHRRSHARRGVDTDADVVIEAVSRIVAQAAGVCQPRAGIAGARDSATNTSTSIDAIASATASPERVVGSTSSAQPTS